MEHFKKVCVFYWPLNSEYSLEMADLGVELGRMCVQVFQGQSYLAHSVLKYLVIETPLLSAVSSYGL